VPREAWLRIDAIARITAAVIGTLAPALLASGALAAHLPGDRGVTFAIGVFGFVPIWVTAMSFTFLVPRGWLAWAICLGATALLALAAPAAAFWPSLPS